MSWAILCESADLAAQCTAAARQIALDALPSVESDLCRSALRQLEASQPTAVVFLTTPSLGELVELAHAARAKRLTLAFALPAPTAERRALMDVAGELGLCAVAEIRPLCASLALLGCGGHSAFRASTRALGPSDRARLAQVVRTDAALGGELVPLAANITGYVAEPGAAPVPLGEASELVDALAGLRRMAEHPTQVSSSVDDVDARAVLDVIFGPRRALSDPTSKAALAPYGIPLPVEELCGSPSRAAAEAARIGFPVRISLASPDLRVWDHPDLSVDMVDNAARVRETFRQLLAMAEARSGDSPDSTGPAERRVLGVLVAATSDAVALLRVRAVALPRARVAMEVGFADPHGRASSDSTVTILPSEPAVIERALRRLAGADLLFATTPGQRKARIEAVADVLLRLAAFVNDRGQEIEAVELQPLAVLLDGSAEVREACVTVSDWFERNS
jgi:ATP-grasp domain